MGNLEWAMKEGMVFTCEPGIYIQEEGLGIRLENELWGKSESYFRASNALEASVEVAYELSILYRRMNRLEESKVQLELFAARQVAKVDS